MNTNRQTFLGTGWGFPPSFNRLGNTVRMVSDVSDIEEAIFLILNTIPGERTMQPEFGCYINRLAFENINAVFINDLNDMVRLALLRFEPRVKFQSAEVIYQNTIEGVVHIRINFSVIITNNRHNVVYPYYFDEGTNITEMK